MVLCLNLAFHTQAFVEYQVLETNAPSTNSATSSIYTTQTLRTLRVAGYSAESLTAMYRRLVPTREGGSQWEIWLQRDELPYRVSLALFNLPNSQLSKPPSQVLVAFLKTGWGHVSNLVVNFRFFDFKFLLSLPQANRNLRLSSLACCSILGSSLPSTVSVSPRSRTHDC